MEPPPSTYAAQIVVNIEGAKHQAPHGSNHNKVKELLSMILQADRHGSSLDGALDESLEVNQKLIIVILHACLLSSNNVDPFGDPREARQIQVDCLAVVELTVRNRPEVLLSCPPSQVATLSPDTPLFLWLIPHLVNCILRNKDEETLQGISRTLRTVFSTHGGLSKSIYNLNPVPKYGNGCVNDLLHALESSLQQSSTNVGEFVDQIPSKVTLEEALIQRDPTLQNLPKIAPRNIAQAFELANQLIAALSGFNGDGVAISINIPRLRCTWAIDALATLWSTCGLSNQLFADCREDCYSLALGMLRAFTARITAFRFDTSSVERAASTTCHVMLVLLLRVRAKPSVVFSNSVQLQLCRTMLGVSNLSENWPEMIQAYTDALGHFASQKDKHDDVPNPFCQDLYRTLQLVRSSDCESTGVDAVSTQFDNLELGQEAHELGRDVDTFSDTDRPSKRPRLEVDERITNGHANPNACLPLAELGRILGITINSSGDVSKTVLKTFPGLPQSKQCELLLMVGKSACFKENECTSFCTACDSPSQARTSPTRIEQDLAEELYTLMLELVKMSQEQKNPPPRVAAMVSLKRLLMHTTCSSHLELKPSSLGQWCLQSLRSSVRELRLAAVKTLSVFVADWVDQSLVQQNRVDCLDSLRGLSEKGETSNQETCIFGLGEIGSSISSEEEVNIILLRLVEYLGHSNALISNLAFEELQRLSNHSPASAMRLFQPYWRTVAIAAVKDLNKRPQICQQLGDLLGMSVPGFLKHTQFYTIPYLIVTRSQDSLQRIAEANGPESTIAAICLEPSQLATTLAYIMVQPSLDQKSTILTLLSAASPDFARADISEFFRAEPLGIAFELLKIAGDHEDSSRRRAREALKFLAENTPRRSNPPRGSSKKPNVIGWFFEEGALGIMQQLSDGISEAKGPQPLSDRLLCVGAIQEMISLAKSHLCNALPQVCSCLRSAIEDKALCDEAFLAWLTLLKTFCEDDLESLIGSTFAILAQHWDSMSPATQQRAYETISQVFHKYAATIPNIAPTIPSVANIPLLDKFETELGKFRALGDHGRQFQAFARRCQDDNLTVVSRAVAELQTYLDAHQSFLHDSAVTEHPDPMIATLVRSLLGACSRFCASSPEVTLGAARCLGLVGCLDPSKVDMTEEKEEMIVLSNFSNGPETLEFIIFFIQKVLVKTFLSTTDTRSQGLLSFAMQELLKNCGFETSNTLRRDPNPDTIYKRWIEIPQDVRNVLTPFITSHYVLAPPALLPESSYPLHRLHMSHATWLRQLTLDLLGKSAGGNTAFVFDVCKRIIRRQDLAIPNFLLPYVSLNVIISGSAQHRSEIEREFLHVLSTPLPENDRPARESLVSCSQNIFHVMDYCSRWLLEKRKHLILSSNWAAQHGVVPDAEADTRAIEAAETILGYVPAHIMSQRSIECRMYARALYYWEQHIRQKQEDSIADGDTMDSLYEKLQDIYTQIDEPDGIEGISARLKVLNLDQQVVEDFKTGRWTAVQSWCEMRLEESPDDSNVQLQLLTSLRESGQHDMLLNQISAFERISPRLPMYQPFVAEACWMTNDWDRLQDCVAGLSTQRMGEFNVGIGVALVSLYQGDVKRAQSAVDQLRLDVMRGLSTRRIQSLDTCHEPLLKLQALTELEAISGVVSDKREDCDALFSSLKRRLEVVGAYTADKQYLLGLRRAAMQLSRFEFTPIELSSAWLESARLARKAGFTRQALDAVLHASKLDDDAATIEHSRLLWKEGQHRKAIHILEGVIAADAFQPASSGGETENVSRSMTSESRRQNPVAARANLLLAKWIDRAGQSQSSAIIKQYQTAISFENRSEKGHYYLGRHYNKLLDSESAKEPTKQAQSYIVGETAKLVIENYLRSLAYGSKYILQTLPKILSLWLQLGDDVAKSDEHNQQYGPSADFLKYIRRRRRAIFSAVMSSVKKYIDRLPAYVFYTVLSQIIARIVGCNPDVQKSLIDVVGKVCASHPQQAIWSLLTLVKSSNAKRVAAGESCISRARDFALAMGGRQAQVEISKLIDSGNTVSAQLLGVCNAKVSDDKRTKYSLQNQLGFLHAKAAPCRLAIPMEATLQASLPTVTDAMRKHKAFSKDTITITNFLDEATVLTSLIRPRRVRIRGSDGEVYSLLCKPKDDLRKDQRLLEFNSMISRLLKKDAECSKRRLYIRTYAVTPLNEDCGLIEWVDGLRTLRDIILEFLRRRGIYANYNQMRERLAGVKQPKDAHIFTAAVLPQFPPVFHEWFVELFPEPGAWFNARLRFTRSCAVMSLVGHVLGLGDRHGENILVEETAGGAFHVDFNCLFDKGATFECAERVPFRLTHNMVDAMGAYGHDGPFRKAAELTQGILRQHEHTLMTALYPFVHDPTVDQQVEKKPPAWGNPEEVLEKVRMKVRGLLPQETLPLSVEGYVDLQIKEATDPWNLARMYIGWAAFF